MVVVGIKMGRKRTSNKTRVDINIDRDIKEEDNENNNLEESRASFTSSMIGLSSQTY